MQRKVICAILVILAFLFFQMTAQGGEVIKLPEVVVTATRTKKEIDKAPGSVSVIKADEIRKLKIDAVDEAIKWEAGVFVKRRTGMLDSVPAIELGGLPRQCRTLIMIDGIPVNGAYSGTVYLNNLPIDDIDRIEITRGPMSALYGGNSMGGAINIITKTAKKFFWNASLGYGSHTHWRVRVNAGNRFFDKLSISVGHEREETNGYPTSLVTRSISSGTGTLYGGYFTLNPWGRERWVVGDKGDKTAKRWSTYAKASLDVRDTGKLTLSFFKGFHRYDYDEPHTYIHDQNGRLTFGPGYVNIGSGKRVKIDPSYYVSYAGDGEREWYLIGSSYKDVFGPFNFQGKVAYERWNSWYAYATPKSGQFFQDANGKFSEANSYSWFVDLQLTSSFFPSHTTTFGFYFRYDNYDGDDSELPYYRDEDIRGRKLLETGGKDRFISFYGQDEWKVLENFTFYAGVRIDWWRSYDGYSSAVGDFPAKEDYCISPKFSAVYTPFEDTILKASIGRAFRAPNLYELYRTWTWTFGTYYSNPHLDPETLWNYEVDIIQYLFGRKIRLSGTYFHTDIDDFIYGYWKGGNNYKDNIASAEIDGYEFEITIRPIEWIKIWGNYTYYDSEITDCDIRPEMEGKAIAEEPISMANVGADLSYRLIRLSIAAQYIGNIYKSDLNDDTPDVYGGYTRRYWICDMKATLLPQWLKRWEVSISVRNMFDKHYYEYYKGDGRTYFVEVSYKWQ